MGGEKKVTSCWDLQAMADLHVNGRVSHLSKLSSRFLVGWEGNGQPGLAYVLRLCTI